ncbi:MAG TPA: hypothetical protein VNX28_02250, partial [Gemmataceae bacterium]|nr:hypothetical protein [Gemmataceae bacterium]
MAFLQLDKKSRRYRIRFAYGGQEFKRSIKTENPKVARGIQGRVEETIRLLEQGRLEMPIGADPAVFIMSDGKLAQRPVAVRPLTLAELVALYREKFPAGAKEASTASTERIHCKHFVRVFGKNTALQTMTQADVQGYIDRRSQDRWHGKPIKAQTVKKETETFRQLWNWAVGMGCLTGPCPVKGTRHVKMTERPSFKTWEEIERIIARGGVSKEEQAGLWECLFLTRHQVAEILADVQEHDGHPFIFPMFVFVAHT